MSGVETGDTKAATPAGPAPPVAPACAPIRPHAWPVIVLTVGLLTALLIYRQVWAHPTRLTLGGPGHINDPIQTMWNLKWVPWQLLHGRDPFSTKAIYYPHGVSLSWNTCTPTLGVLAAPFTLTIGPVFTYVLLMTLAPALAALTGFWWLRRHTTKAATAALGGLIIGFNPYMSGHLQGHLDLVFVALVPIILMLFEDLLWRRPRPNRRTAVYLGLVSAAQAGISEETLLITALAVAVALACSTLADPRRVWSMLRSSSAAMLGATAVFLLASSPLLIPQLLLTTPVQLHGAYWRATIGDYLLPLHRQLLDPHWAHATYLGGAEDGVYLGITLTAVLILGIAATARRDPTVRVAAATLAMLMLFTFGDAHPGGVPLPWTAFSHLPVLTSILPARFSFASYLIIAWLITHWTDTLSRGPSPGRLGAWPARWLAVTAVAAALVTIIPNQVEATATPRNVTFFTRHKSQTLLGPAATILLLPSPTFADASGMFYQMQADFSFNQPGGYALRPDHNQAAYGPPDSPLTRLAADAITHTGRADEMLVTARTQLATEHYRAIVVIRTAPAATHLIRLARRLTGRNAD
ncbi:MAG: hypothetical protein QOF87_1937, partial [Pseudonocardiales bacterium]|nr:hypothetical protein [Pseudonocardiales bacterium]